MKVVREWFPFILTLLIIILIRSYIITPVRVDGSSMNDTLNDGDILLLEKYDQKYERFEVVVFNLNGEMLIKRVIGLPGDIVEFKNNKLYINNEEIEDNYGYGNTEDFVMNEQIPAKHYFLVGDNRNDSLDSRFFGFISEDKIIGSARFIIFPFSRFGNIQK